MINYYYELIFYLYTITINFQKIYILKYIIKKFIIIKKK